MQHSIMFDLQCAQASCPCTTIVFQWGRASGAALNMRILGFNRLSIALRAFTLSLGARLSRLMIEFNCIRLDCSIEYQCDLSYSHFAALVHTDDAGWFDFTVRTAAGDKEMKYVIGMAHSHWVFSHPQRFAQTRYFLFPSEVSEFASQNARAVNLFGIATDVQTTETDGVQFLISDKSVSIPVIYQGQLPQEFEDGNPAIVLGEFDGTVLFANVIIVQFSSKHTCRQGSLELNCNPTAPKSLTKSRIKNAVTFR